MPIALTNALLMDLDPLSVRAGGLRVEGATIAAAGADVRPQAEDEVIDCGGAVVLPGLVNGHTHLYSALATGMPPPPRAPKNFYEILDFVWWRLDRALDAESIEMSGLAGALTALRCGTTTLVDHHASPGCIDGSLDWMERGVGAAGLRLVQCYEVSDRCGPAGTEAGLAENRRYLKKCAERSSRQFAALVGAHAAFTLSDESLNACAELARDFKTGVHIHVAEDPCDDRICRERYGAPLVERLERCGIMEEGGAVAERSIIGHCTHLALERTAFLSERVAGVAHNTRSNMNNSVGYAPIGRLRHVQLGTDGIGSDMFTESKHAWFKACDGRTGIRPADVIAMLNHSARVAGRLLGCTLGRLQPHAAADIVITDYRPATPLDAENAAGHFLFGLGSEYVRDVMVAGQWRLRDRCVQGLDEAAERRSASMAAYALWRRMERIEPFGELSV